MTQNVQTLGLFSALRQEFLADDFLGQIMAMLGVFFLSFCVALFLRRQSFLQKTPWLKATLTHLLFPFLCVFFLGGALIGAQKMGHSCTFLEVALHLCSAWIFVRALVLMLRYAFPQNAFLKTSETIIIFSIWLWMALYVMDIAPILAQHLDSIALTVGEVRFSLWRLINGVLLVFLVVVVAFCFSAMLEKRLMQSCTWDMSLRIIGVRIIKAVFMVMAGLMSLSILGINMTALSVFTGALGVGLGFGFQKIASNYVSGFIILLERSVQLGNFVTVSGLTGKVTQITTRFTVLKTASGEEIIVPNEMLVSNIVQNKTLSDSLLKVSLDVGIAYGSDVDLASRLMRESALKEPRVLKTPEPVVLLVGFGESAINLTLSFWIADPENGSALLSSDINRRIWGAFKENQVSMPFPQREVRILNEESA